MIGIIDYGAGNLQSVLNSLEFLGAKVQIISDPQKLKDVDRIILPGVGAFAAGMSGLKQFIPTLQDEVFMKKKPFLGICLGMQLLATTGTEDGVHPGLGWIDGTVTKFDVEKKGLKVPHVGWNDITIEQVNHPLWKGLSTPAFYFVHSYYFACKHSKDVAASTDYGMKFSAAIAKDNLFAVQFHPEKSQDDGLRLLENFLNWNGRLR